MILLWFPMKCSLETNIQKGRIFVYIVIQDDLLDMCRCNLNHNFLNILLSISMVVSLCMIDKDNTFYSFPYEHEKKWMNGWSFDQIGSCYCSISRVISLVDMNSTDYRICGWSTSFDYEYNRVLWDIYTIEDQYL